MSVSIKYKNAEILNIPSGGDYKLNTSGKYLEADIRITDSGGAEYPVWQGSDNYVYLSDTANAPVEIYADDEGYVVLDMRPAEISLQAKTKSYTPTETAQSETVTADNGYDGLSSVAVSVGAISSTYVGSGIARKSSSDLTTSGATVTVPVGYYASTASKSVASGSAGTPTATKSAVSNNTLTVTPSVTNTTGYITGGTKSGTAVSVSASELVNGTKSIIENGTGIDVANYRSVDVAVPSSGADVAIFTLTSEDPFVATCNLTWAECFDRVDAGHGYVAMLQDIYGWNAPLGMTEYSLTYICYTEYDPFGEPYSDIMYYSNGTISQVIPSHVGQTPSGGSSYTPISVGVLEVTANITSTSVTTISTSLTIDASALTSSKMLYVKIRDKAGKRNNYFYGTDMFFPIWDSDGGGTTQSPAKQVYRIGNTGGVGAYTPSSTTCYGVYVSGITDLGEVYVMGRYSSSYSYTINGTYSIDIYTLEWPNNVSPMI